MTVWLAGLVIVATALLVARRWLPDRELAADMAYDAYRTLVPAPRPTVRLVTRRVARACARRRVIMPFSQKPVLPRSFTVDLHPDEYAVVAPLRDTVCQAVAASLERTARAKQWQHAGVPEVFLRAGDDVAEGRPVVSATTLPRPSAATRSLPPARTGSLAAERTSALPVERTTALPAERPDTPAAERTSALPGAAPPAYRDPGQVSLTPEPTAAETGALRALRHRLCSLDPATGDIVVERAPVTVGRAPDCGLVITYAAASRRHFRLAGSGAGVHVEDLDSRHGTRVNGRPVTAPVLLRPRDLIQIGVAGPSWRYQPDGGSS